MMSCPTQRLTYLGHATVLIEMEGVRVLTDPVLRQWAGPLHRHSASIEPDCRQRIDAVLLSHLHYDHLDRPSLDLLGPNTRVIVPRGAGQLLRGWGFHRAEELSAGDSASVGPLTVTATHAEHSGFRPPFGPTADCLGFVVRGSHRIYFAGDTDLFPEMAQLAGQLDVALLPVWGWGPNLGAGHLDPRRAAEALTLLRPRLAVPVHWGTLAPIGLRWLRPSVQREPPREFQREASVRAPGVKVSILEPGAWLSLCSD